MPETTDTCRPWCTSHFGGTCAAAFDLYAKPAGLRGREALPGIELRGAGGGTGCNDLELSVGSEFPDDQDEAPALWCTLNLSLVDESYRGEPAASFQTNGPGMRTIHAQLGRFLALAGCGQAHRAELESGIRPGSAGWAARHRAHRHPDDCQPWCREHGDDGCRLTMTLGLAAGSGEENLVHCAAGETAGAVDLLAARALYTPGAAGSRGRFHLALDCWNTLGNDRDGGRTDRTASLPATLPALKRVHARLGGLLVEVGAAG